MHKVTGVRTAIVGAGLMGRWHAHYAARAGAEIAAIVDRNPGAIATLQERHPGAQGFSDLGACLTQTQIDVVHICTSPASHVSLATIALEARKHVLVEKPFAPTVAETEQLLNVAARNGVNINPVHQFPFQSGFGRLCQQLNRLGDLVHVSFVTCSAGGEGRDDTDRQALLFEILPHPLSLVRALLGAETPRTSWTLTTLTADELAMHSECRQMSLQIRISLRGRPTRNTLTVIGTRGTAHVDLFHGYVVFETGRPSRRTKFVQPFAYGNKLLVTASGNMIRRLLNAEFAYPGLGELVTQFYRANSYGLPAPISEAEILESADTIDQLRD